MEPAGPAPATIISASIGTSSRLFPSVYQIGGAKATDWLTAGEILLGPERFRTGRADLLAYSYDATPEKAIPAAVAFPETTEEVSELLRLAGRYRVPVTPRGAGTNLSGGSIPVPGGLVLSTARLNRILAVDPLTRQARVQPGVVNLTLQEALAPYGLRYMPDPSSWRVSTLGGNAAENAGGPHGLRFGVTAEHILGLEVVWPDGETERLSPGESGSGLLLLGAEGTLGVITELNLRLLPLPEAAKTAWMAFPTPAAAFRAASAFIAGRLVPAALEVMDRATVNLVEPFARAGLSLTAGAVLLLELEGTPSELPDLIRRTEELARGAGAEEIRWAETAVQAEAVWLARRSVWAALAGVSPTFWTQDVTVPRPALAEMFASLERLGGEHGFVIYTAAHAGDGNLHPVIPYRAAERERLLRADREILRTAVRLGGSVTGEHGVGIEKREALAELGEAGELRLGARVKELLDPAGLLNPGKLYPPTLPPEAEDLRPAEAEILRALAAAQEEGRPVRFGAGPGELSPPDGPAELDPENLTARVPAGMRLGEMAEFFAANCLAWAGRALAMPGLSLGAALGRGLGAPAPFGLAGSILALRVATAEGRILRLGRPVMKNVAGLRLLPLFLGTRGVFGLILEATLRLRPAPAFEGAAVFDFSGPEELLAAAETLKGISSLVGREVVGPGLPGSGERWLLRLALEDEEGVGRCESLLGRRAAREALTYRPDLPGEVVGWLDPRLLPDLRSRVPGVSFVLPLDGEPGRFFASGSTLRNEIRNLGGWARPRRSPPEDVRLERIRRALDPNGILWGNGERE